MCDYKTCTKCGESKLLEEYYRDKKTRDGRTYTCKECVKEYRQRSDVKERRRNYLIEYRQRPGVKQKEREAVKKYQSKPGNRERKIKRDRERRRRPKVKEQIRAYTRSQAVKDRQSQRNKADAEALTDYYISKIIYIQSGKVIPHSEAPPELIELKRQSIKLKRLIKQKQDEQE